MKKGRIESIKFRKPGYLFKNKLQVGSTLDEALKVLGQPTKTVEGKENELADGVLYKDIDGKTGRCYYKRADHNVRLFFWDYKVVALYVTSSDYPAGGAFASDGSFFISDTANGRVQHYSGVGNLEATWFAGIEEPHGMCTGPYGGLWVADAQAQALHWYAAASFEHRQLDLPDMRPVDVCILGDVVYVLSIDPPALVRVRVLRGE